MFDLRQADLHIHSNCSDGTDDWRTILRKAEEADLLCISITDHDNCRVYCEMENPEKYFSGKIITGIEMQAYFEGMSIELLGYGFNAAEMPGLLRGLYLPFSVVNQEELKRLHARCAAQGMRFEPDVIEKYDSGKYFYATEYLHSAMRMFAENKTLIPDIESWEHEHIFFKRHTSNSASPFYVDESELVPSVGKVVDVIHHAGGKVFIPHVYQYEENALRILSGLTDNYPIDGVECYYPSFSQAETDYLLGFCRERGLWISGGSDYHGSKRPDISLGIRQFIPIWNQM